MADASYREESSQSASAFERERERQLDAPASQRSIAELFGSLIGDAQTLVRKEIELARTETMQEIDKVRQSAVAMAIGGGIAAVGGILLLLAIVQVLVVFANLPLWSAYLLVGGICAIIGLIALSMGMVRAKQVDPVPRETIASVRKDLEWLKEQNPSDKT